MATPEPPAAAPASSKRRRRWLREPLLHFLALGLVLFVVYRVLNPAPEADRPSDRIELTPDDMVQMSVAWLAQGRAPPTPEQMRSLIELKVREEILYREALALGLDKEDAIVKRRLAQKMEFLADATASTADPTPDALRSWFASNQPRFALSPRITFRHLYFSPDQRGEQAQEAALQTVATLGGKPVEWPDGKEIADQFMYQDRYADHSYDETAKLFGPAFTRALFDLKPGSWKGPIESGYGWHVVFVEAKAPSRTPAFEEIESDVRTEWQTEQRAQARSRAYEATRARYQIVLPEPPAETPTAAPAAGTQSAVQP
jgi:hypothetical protein